MIKMCIILKMLNNWYFVTYFWNIILRYVRNSCTMEFCTPKCVKKSPSYGIVFCALMMCENKWCVKNNGFKAVIEIALHVRETVFYRSFYIKFKGISLRYKTYHIILNQQKSFSYLPNFCYLGLSIRCST